MGKIRERGISIQMNIREYMFDIVEYIVIAYMISKCLEVEVHVLRKKFIVTVLSVAAISNIIYNSDSVDMLFMILRTVVPFLLIIFMTYFLFCNRRVLLSIIVGIEVSIIYILCQIFILTVLKPITESFNGYAEILSYQESYRVILFFVAIAAINMGNKMVIRITTEIAKFTAKLDGNSITRVVCYCICAVTLVYILVYMFFMYRGSTDFSHLLLVLLLIMIMESINITTTAKESNLEDELAQQRLYMANYKTILDDVRGFWHSYTNIMQVVSLIVNDTGDVSRDELKEVFGQFTDWEKVNKLGQKIKLINIPHVALGGLMSSKLQKATDLDVNLNITSKGKAEISMNMRDLLEIVGVLVDNAIEAAYFTDDKSVQVRIEMDDTKFTFDIENNFVEERGVIKKYGRSNGVGLYRVNTIVNNKHNARFTTNKTDTHYSARLEILNDKGI